MRFLTIDIGTNSTLYLISEFNNAKPSTIRRGIFANHLGEKLASDNSISADLLEHNICILTEIMRISREYKCTDSLGIGTHALRTGTNSDELVIRAKRLGLSLKVISEEEESRLAWKGVFEWENKTHKTNYALLDLGGGSSELSLGKGSCMARSSSVPIGAVNLARTYFLSDPPIEEDIVRARQYILNSMNNWSEYNVSQYHFVGIAGTITTLAALKNEVYDYHPGRLDNLILSIEQISRLKDQLLKLSIKQRGEIPGMPFERVNSIHAGALLLFEIMTLINAKQVSVCERGLMFGLALDAFAQHAQH